MEDLLLSKEFTIDDLKYGYLVETRDGRYALYMPSQNGDVFDFGSINYSIMNYKKNLKYDNNRNSNVDIVKVFGFAEYGTIQLTTDNRELLWERKERETVKMTVDEMREKLEALIDQNVEIKYEKSQHRDTNTTVQKNELNNYCLTVFCSNCIFGHEDCNFDDMNSEKLEQCYERLKEVK